MKTLCGFVLLLWCFAHFGLDITSQCYAQTAGEWNDILQALRSRDPERQTVALMSFRDGEAIPDEIAPQIASVLTDMAKTNNFGSIGALALTCLGEMGPKATNALPFLSSVVTNSGLTDSFRERAFRAISHIAPNSPTDTIAMTSFLNSPADEFFTIALYRLYNSPQYHSSDQFIPLLLERLASKSTPDDWKIIRALGYIGAESDVTKKVIRERMRSWNADNRAEAITALRHAKAVTQEDIKTIGVLLSDTETKVRRAAIETLNLSGTNAFLVIEEIKRAATKDDEFVERGANNILRRWREQSH